MERIALEHELFFTPPCTGKKIEAGFLTRLWDADTKIRATFSESRTTAENYLWLVALRPAIGGDRVQVQGRDMARPTQGKQSVRPCAV